MPWISLIYSSFFRTVFGIIWIFSTFCTTSKCETNMQTLPNQPICALEIGNQQSSMVTLIAVFVLTFSSSMGKYMHIYLKTTFFVILFIWNASVGLLDCSWTICHSENDITIFYVDPVFDALPINCIPSFLLLFPVFGCILSFAKIFVRFCWDKIKVQLFTLNSNGSSDGDLNDSLTMR